MPAQIIDGKALAERSRATLAPRIATLAARGVTPGLTVVLVGDDPASAVYVRHKVLACERTGLRSSVVRLPATTTQAELLDRLAALNADPAVHGILVQLPLPSQIDEHRVIAAITPEKDVDGFHVSNAGLLLTGRPRFRPCTPYGVMTMLASVEVPLRGAHAVVLGRSNIVGKPMALLLLAADATVTIAHSRTRDLPALTRQADVLIAAVGRAGTVTADMVKPGAAVIDVGINRRADGGLVGDVDFASVAAVAGWITPVPGGVGPMTIAMLLVNTVAAAEHLAAA